MTSEAALQGGPANTDATCIEASTGHGRRKPTVAELLATPSALLSRSHLRELGLERRAIDAIFKALPVVAIPGYSRPMIRVADYLELLDEYTYRDDRVRA